MKGSEISLRSRMPRLWLPECHHGECRPRAPNRFCAEALRRFCSGVQLLWSGRGDLNPRPPRPERDSAQRCYLHVRFEKVCD